MLKKYHLTGIFIIFILLPISQSSSHQPWQPLYDRGTKYIETGQLDSAKVTFEKILETDKNIAEAYYGLGIIAEQEKPGNPEAKKLFKKAIKHKPDFAEAYYYLGKTINNNRNFSERYTAPKYYEKAIELDSSFSPAWKALSDFYKNRQNINKAITTQGKAFSYIPFDKDLFNTFLESVFWYSQEETGKIFLLNLIKKYPKNCTFQFHLAKLYFALEKYQQSLFILDKYDSKCMGISECQFHYLKAKLYFNLNKNKLGNEHYNKALALVKDKADADLFYPDLCYIMNNNEYKELVTLKPEEIEQFYQRFWLSRDPALSTELNERMSEHYNRLAFARKNFRRYVVGSSEYEFYHKWKTKSKAGQELINEYQTNALPEKRELDDMGLIYVRHGNPDKWVTSAEADMFNLSWLYYAKNKTPKMIFHFSKGSGARGWVMTLIPITFSNRAELDPKYAVMDPYVHEESYIIGQFDAIEIPHRLAIENEKYVQVGLHKETTEFKVKKELLKFPLNILCFKGKQGKTLVEVYYGVDGNQAQIETSGKSSYLELDSFLGIYDSTWHQITKEKNDERIELGHLSKTEWLSSSFIAKRQVSILPGKYHIEFQLHDKVADKLGAYKGTTQLVNYHQDELMISDILVSDIIKSSDSTARFRKGDLSYEPHMFSPFNKNAVIGLYFEIYNLAYNQGGTTKYEITYAIQPKDKNDKAGFFRSLFKSNKKNIALSYETRGRIRDEIIFNNLDTQNINSGNYEIIIEVRDKISGQKTQKKVDIQII